MKMLRLTVVFLLIAGGGTSAFAQPQSKTYLETRKLLLQMEHSHEYAILKKLFEQGERRKPDLIYALNDPEAKVTLNAQRVIMYLADQESLAALSKWYEYRRTQANEIWTPPVKIFTEVKNLEGDDRDLVKLILQTLYPSRKEGWGNTVAYNTKSRTALVEILFGQVFTEGRHVIIRKEKGKWRVLSDTLIWQS